MGAAAAGRKVFLSRPCFLFDGWGVSCVDVWFCLFWYRLRSLATSEQSCLLTEQLPATQAHHLGPPSFDLPRPLHAQPAVQPAETRAPGWAGGTRAFLLQDVEKPLFDQRIAGWARRGASLQVFRSFWNPLLLARPGLGRTGLLTEAEFGPGLGNVLSPRTCGSFADAPSSR